jgi:hypothetical protein
VERPALEASSIAMSHTSVRLLNDASFSASVVAQVVGDDLAADGGRDRRDRDEHDRAHQQIALALGTEPQQREHQRCATKPPHRSSRGCGCARATRR